MAASICLCLKSYFQNKKSWWKSWKEGFFLKLFKRTKTEGQSFSSMNVFMASLNDVKSMLNISLFVIIFMEHFLGEIQMDLNLIKSASENSKFWSFFESKLRPKSSFMDSSYKIIQFVIISSFSSVIIIIRSLLRKLANSILYFEISLSECVIHQSKFFSSELINLMIFSDISSRTGLLSQVFVRIIGRSQFYPLNSE